MSRDLLVRLVLPLSLVFVVSAILSSHLNQAFDTASFLLNISNDTLAIIVTVWYVDWALRSHEQKRWRLADTLIAERLSAFATNTVLALVNPIGFASKLYPESNEYMTLDISGVQRHIMNQARQIQLNELESQSHTALPSWWSSSIAELKTLHAEATMLLDIFGNRISPELLSLILRVQNKLDGAISAFSLFHTLGIDDKKSLLSVVDSTKEQKEVIDRYIASYIIHAIPGAIELYNSIESNLRRSPTSSVAY